VTEPSQTIAVFLGALSASCVLSFLLGKSLEKVCTRLALPSALVGAVTALGANSPEISSAVAAIAGGRHDLGLGVVFGSNIFNLAALLGLGSLVSGRIRFKAAGMLLSGGVASIASLIGVGLVTGTVNAAWSLGLFVLVLVPYLVALGHKRPREAPTEQSGVARWLERARSGVDDAAKAEWTPSRGSWRDALIIIPTAVATVWASIEMIDAATKLGDRWGISHAVLGSLVVATLTGVPNLVAALRLALHHRGVAIVSETFNSNNLNLLIGAVLPALLMRPGTASSASVFNAWFALALTVVTVALPFLRGQGCILGRARGTFLLLAYAGFVIATLLDPFGGRGPTG
jgi:cation:H+ antiporter